MQIVKIVKIEGSKYSLVLQVAANLSKMFLIFCKIVGKGDFFVIITLANFDSDNPHNYNFFSHKSEFLTFFWLPESDVLQFYLQKMHKGHDLVSKEFLKIRDSKIKIQKSRGPKIFSDSSKQCKPLFLPPKTQIEPTAPTRLPTFAIAVPC